MQIFALLNGAPVKAEVAQKGKRYECPECGAPVFVRKGVHKRAHYYHALDALRCRQNQKGLVHLQVQSTLVDQFSENEARLECPFPSIRRIADLFWEKEGIIFEIQCSPISEEEARSRSRDYQALGLRIVWILHDQRFNKNKLSSAESWLRASVPCYYTNIAPGGSGICYDQFEVLQGACRLFKGPPLPLELRFLGKALKEKPPGREGWNLNFKGDLVDQWRFADAVTQENMARLEESYQERFSQRARMKYFYSFMPSFVKSFIFKKGKIPDAFESKKLLISVVRFIRRKYERLLDACIRSLSDS